MKKLKIFICVFLLILTISINCYAKYVIERRLNVANIRIDLTKPEIRFLSATSNNEGYNNYANKTHTVTVKLLAIEENLKEEYLFENVVWLVDDEEVKGIDDNAHSSHYRDTINYEITLNDITGNGKLKVKIPKRYNYR